MSSGFAHRIPASLLSGLRPRAWVCVGQGFSREDVKASLLNQGLGFTGDAITSLPSIAMKILANAARGQAQATDAPAPVKLDASRVLSGLARQEVLRILLADSRISARLPELKRLKRQSGFFRKLDQALQKGRAAFAHEEEALVYSERLEARFGKNPVRDELQRLTLAYEAWLDGSNLLDPPMLLKRAAAVLNEQGWPEPIASVRPEAIHVFTAQSEESLERAFWEALSRHVEVVRTGPLHQPAQPDPEPREPWAWDLWHTIDDAAEELAERLATDEARTGFKDCVVLIPDSSSARRSLRRALESRGVPLADPRDPTRLRWEEGLKWATLPVQAVARGFDREDSIAYLRAHCAGAELPLWIQEIRARGIRNGLQSYSGGKLTAAHSRLTELHEALGGRRTCAELGEAHLKLLRLAVAQPDMGSAAGTPGAPAAVDDKRWIVPFFEGLWREFVADAERVGQAKRKAPPLYWWERLQARLSESPAPVERFKPEQGVAVYRLHQAPLVPVPRVYALGLPANWLSAEALGDYWFSARERELLSGEFAVRSSITARQERLHALQAWVARAQGVTWLDAAYDADGREREAIGALLAELAASLRLPEGTAPMEPVERGAHPRWLASYGALRPLPPLEIRLQPLARGPGGAPPEITATAIDSYSRCGFMALAYQRWKLRDSREPDTELWPEARGNILHAAVRILLESRDGQGVFQLTTREALDQAWKLENPRGLLRSHRAEAYVREKMIQVLEAFREKEYEYFGRAPSRIASLDSQYFKLEFEDVSIIGTPDRIDEHPEGIFVLDYKTSSALPNGSDMVELGYRLQLPFYALAAQRSLGKPVLGVQFVELNKKGGRGSGIFFRKYNGKEPGKLTQLRSNSKSLLAIEPEQAWSSLAEQVHRHARRYVSGEFHAHPKKDKECATCSVSDLCGFRRLTERPGGGTGGEGIPE